MEKLISLLFEEKIAFEKDVNLASYTYSKTGKKVKLIVYPATILQVERFVHIAKKVGIQWKVIGNTTNLLFSDAVVYSCFLNLKKIRSIKIDTKNRIVAEAGVDISELSRFFLYKEYKGFEGLEGIPGNLGGAITMNAGAYGYNISDYVESCQVLHNGHVKKLSKAELCFGKRSSILLGGNYLLLSTTFSGLEKGEAEGIEKRMRVFHAARHSYQEFNYPNLGSIFCLDDKLHNLLMENTSLLTKIKYKFYNYLFYNRFSKMLNRKDPTDFGLTCYVTKCRKLSLDFDVISRRNLNTFINVGYSTLKILQHFNSIYQLVDKKDKIKIENEFVYKAILEVNETAQFEQEQAIYIELTNG
ncbi:UDP-N-acetylmuramate dehydrogenase [Psychrosphaera aestuarii]|uniref:UDP-N-acetylmuramate dehydrogenase n=1 Tax=Psychrosphaera aestuarii TaxID=1266052 RepID=UPI001B32A0FB|nr:FAD-binding protein [Psychrosphaera aestuarii]